MSGPIVERVEPWLFWEREDALSETALEAALFVAVLRTPRT